MKLSKVDREIVKQKFGGRCAYCGVLLPNKFHVDHVKPLVRNWIDGTVQYPERHSMDNLYPACISCNINKHSFSLEGFRENIQGFIKSLNRDSTQYKVAKRYGLIEETNIPVKFYFEEYQEKSQ